MKIFFQIDFIKYLSEDLYSTLKLRLDFYMNPLYQNWILIW